ncbi:MAG: hypothetical protein TR69_WS6001000586 [candidate division WS6 bacterium OLB20]|uniref:Uncharacterized protein n=1 Tax=candidate division WS6 bacterium OLB20 TaxID=1617426 RepID=A0A136LY44_9BACT|nr:MAG: hypothetical protein TR69_WS6001000586 [candidate division WS6 bacterium OLB20]
MKTNRANLLFLIFGILVAVTFVTAKSNNADALSMGVGCWTRWKQQYSMGWHCDGSASVRNRPYDVWVWHCQQANLSWCDANNGGVLITKQSFGGPVPVEFTSSASGYGNCGSVQMDIGLPGASDHGVAGGAIYSNGTSCSSPPQPTTPPSQCGNWNDTQFWTGCWGEPYPGCGGLGGWISGNDVTSRNPSRPFPLDINCFTNLGSAWTSATVSLVYNGSTIGNYNTWAPRNINISSPGTYEALCRDRVAPNCYDIDRFTVQCVNTCGSARDPNAPTLSSPSNGATLTNRNVTLTWSHSGFGRCGGNSCSGGCNSTNPTSLSVTLNGPGGGTVVLPGGSTSYTFTNLTGKNYTWYVTARNGCNLTEQSVVRSFVINSPPTFNGSVTSNQICTAGGVTTGGSAQWSGIHANSVIGNGTSGINNPLTVRVTYDDPDGRADLNRLEVWLGDNNSPAPGATAVSTSASASLAYGGGSNHTLYAAGGSSRSIDSNNSGNQAVLTSGSNTQSIVAVSGSTTGTAYALPRIVSTTATSVVVDWQLGLFNSSAFDGDVRIYARAVDQSGVAAGWSIIDTWRVDLRYPNPVANLTLRNQTAFDVTYSANDATSPVLSYSKTCTSSLAASESITLNQVAPGASPNSRTFTGNQNQNPCFDNLAGTTYYTVNNTPRDGTLRFNWTAKDSACNTAPSTSADLRLKPPWMMTVDGDTFTSQGIRQTSINDINTINNPNLPDQHNRVPYLSDYNFMLETGSLPAKDTERDLAVDDYDDLNGKPRAEFGFPDWFSFVDARILRNLPANQIATVNGPQTFSDVTSQQVAQALGMTGVEINGFAGTGDAKVNVIKVIGNLTLNRVSCNTKTIFLVTGNLTINPESRISDDPRNDVINGCMYVVAGRTTVLPGQNADVLGAATERARVLGTSAQVLAASFETAATTAARNNNGQCVVGILTNHADVYNSNYDTGYGVGRAEIQALVPQGYVDQVKLLTQISPATEYNNIDLLFVNEANLTNLPQGGDPNNALSYQCGVAGYVRAENPNLYPGMINAVYANWLNGMNIIMSADNGISSQRLGSTSTCFDFANSLTGPLNNAIMSNHSNAFNFLSVGDASTNRLVAGQYDPTDNGGVDTRVISSGPAMLSGAFQDYRGGRDTPGNIVHNGAGGINAQCLSTVVLQDRVDWPTINRFNACTLAYVPPTSTRGYYVIDSNAATAVRSKWGSMLTEIPDCNPPTPTPTAVTTPVTTPPANAPTLNSVSATCTGTGNNYNISASWTGGGTGTFWFDIDDQNPHAVTWFNHDNGNNRSMNVNQNNFQQYTEAGNSRNSGVRLALTPGATYYAKVYDAQRAVASNYRSFTAPVCSTPTPTPPPIDTNADYDTLDGFILTNSFESPFDSQYDGLRIVGAVIAMENNNFNRDFGVVLNQLTPSEIIYYDGGRYMYLFGRILSMPNSFNIVEKPFIDSF